MALPEAFPPIRPPGPQQRWANLLVLLLGVGGMMAALILREQILGATIPYSNLQAGISARYPPQWLLEETGGDYVFRIRDLSAAGFATTLQVALFPVNDEVRARNIFDALTLQRSRSLAAYSVNDEAPYSLPDGRTTPSMSYFFAGTGENPFLNNVPVIVRGVDVLLFEREQALVISFQASADAFDAELPHLQRFLQSLDF